MVLELFRDVETSLLERVSPLRAHKASCAIRAFFEKASRASCLDPRFRQLRSFFKSRCMLKRVGRPSISDVPHASRPMLEILPHESLKNLYQRASDILKADLERVRVAALSVITSYVSSVSELDRICGIDVSNNEKDIIDLAVRWNYAAKSKRQIPPWSSLDVERYISLRLAINKGKSADHWVFSNGPLPVFVVDHVESLVGAKLLGHQLGAWFSCREMPANEVLISCALLIQIKTGWNFSSVLELSLDSVVVTSFPHRLQSIKSKSGDQTPPVLIEKSDTDVILALSILSSRIKYFEEYKMKHSGIWTGRALDKDGTLRRTSSWSLHSFCRKFNLPLFSPEMLRVQILAVDSVNRGDVSLAQSRAGHTSSKTTFHYINKEIIKKLSSANSLEFEQRFDNTVRYMIDPGAVAEGVRVLSYPIGDGASCSKPNSPPMENWLVDGICAAERCHDGEGCTNRVVNIDILRIEEVQLTKNFYQNNWLELLNRNPAGFEKNHLPKMLFAFALFGAISRGPYRHLLKEFDK